jgi:RimJ/RimL family protein N-acetyltransferase
MIEFIPILPSIEENSAFANNPDCADTLQMCIDYYKVIGYNPPWICYYAHLDGALVGSAAFKGKPVDNKIEIAYGTLPRFRNKGIGAAICKHLVLLARSTDPNVIITARTLPQENYSTKILRKNNFKFLGEVLDKEDGKVWEWLYREQNSA